MPMTPERKREFMVEYNQRPEVKARKKSPEARAKHAEQERARRAAQPDVYRAREQERWQRRKNDPEYLERARDYNRGWMREHRKTWTPEQKAAAAASRRKYMADNPGKTAQYARKQNYGITTAQWDEMFASQGSCCAICKSIDPHSTKGWQTDHCHDTGKVRGILCADCNRIVHNRVNMAVLHAAMTYLES